MGEWLWSEPTGSVVPSLGYEDRRTLKRRLREGELDELEMEAVVFVGGQNRNHVRFREEELPGFAASFVGKPFLRNHDVGDVGSRDGTVVESRWDGNRMVQRIRLTTERGMRDYLDGVLDRFSIGWYFDRAECGVCGREFLGCGHQLGREYDGVRCEVVFSGVMGKEVSAVNAPAVEGTGLLSRLMEEKMEKMEKQGMEAMEVGLSEVVAAVEELRREREAERRLAVLRSSGLSEAGQAAVRAAGEVDVVTFERLVEAQLAAEAAAAERGLVRGVRPLGTLQMETPEDRVQAALDWVFGWQGAALPSPSMRNVRELYQAITGDSEWRGMFNPAYAQLSAASTTTLAGMVVNALNKVVRMHYDNMATYRWYEPLVMVTPHDGTTHDVQLILVDGMANLPTVLEGAAYTEATVGDSKESMAFVKRGHYVGITLEAFRRSDIQRLQAIPREMVKSAVRTRSAAVAALFTVNSGTGPTMAEDSTVLFHSSHGNLGTGAFGATEWAAARSRIWKQTVPGTGNRLGLWPTYCLVPIDVYDSALEIFGYGSGDVGKPNAGGTAQTPNPYGQSRAGDPRPIPVAVPEWTDTNDWAYLVDPRLHPVIHMAYANAMAGGGHPMPEIFEVASETSGLMFTNDTLPVKVRDWWAVGVSTWVGIGKNNVA